MSSDDRPRPKRKLRPRLIPLPRYDFFSLTDIQINDLISNHKEMFVIFLKLFKLKYFDYPWYIDIGLEDRIEFNHIFNLNLYDTFDKDSRFLEETLNWFYKDIAKRFKGVYLERFIEYGDIDIDDINKDPDELKQQYKELLHSFKLKYESRIFYLREHQSSDEYEMSEEPINNKYAIVREDPLKKIHRYITPKFTPHSIQSIQPIQPMQINRSTDPIKSDMKKPKSYKSQLPQLSQEDHKYESTALQLPQIIPPLQPVPKTQQQTQQQKRHKVYDPDYMVDDGDEEFPPNDSDDMRDDGQQGGYNYKEKYKKYKLKYLKEKNKI